MTQIDSLLLHGWRALACLGYYSRLTAISNNQSNNVLRYHSVGGEFYDDISPDRLRAEIEYFDSEYEIVDLPAVFSSGGTKRIALTFDDGYRDFYQNVVPILHEYDVPATVFVITEALDDPSFTHNDRFDYEYMEWDQLQELVDDPLVTVGNHTRTHPDLSTLSPAQLEQEVIGAKQRLEERLETTVERFCYPFCRFDNRAIDSVQKSHEIGVGGRGRRESISEATNPAATPRINGANPPWEVRWDLSEMATVIGSACDQLIGSGKTSDPPTAAPATDDSRVVDSAKTP